MSEHTAENAALGTFLRFADAVQTNAERAHRPVYAETCPCGGSIEVGRDVTAAERRRIHAAFHGRHCDCIKPAARGFGLLCGTSDETDLSPITGGLDEETECVLPPAKCPECGGDLSDGVCPNDAYQRRVLPPASTPGGAA